MSGRPAWRPVEGQRTRPVPRALAPAPAEAAAAGAPPEARYRRSHPWRAFAVMVLPMLAAPLVLFVPFLGWVLLLVLLPIEFGRIGGRRVARPDALWVAVPASAAVSLYEIGLVLVVLDTVPGFHVGLDLYGTLMALVAFGFNGFFYSVGALSTSFDPLEPVAAEARSPASP